MCRSVSREAVVSQPHYSDYIVSSAHGGGSGVHFLLTIVQGVEGSDMQLFGVIGESVSG